MRDYSLRKKGSSHHAHRSTLVRVIATIAIAFFLIYTLGGLLGGISSVLTKPWYALATWVSNGSGALPTYLRDRGSLQEEIVRLNAELQDVRFENEQTSSIVAENEELRRLLGSDESAPERIVAGIIGRPPHTPYDTLFLDQGSSDGIVEDAPVYHFDDKLIGFVSNVFTDSSVVTLLSSPAFESTVYVFGPNIYTTAIGIGDGTIRVSVPQNIPIHEGDTVVAPTLAKGFIGTIRAIQSEDAEPEQYGFVIPDTSLQSLRLVSVGKRPVAAVSFDEARAYVDEMETSLFTISIPEDILIDDTATSTDEELSEEGATTSPSL